MSEIEGTVRYLVSGRDSTSRGKDEDERCICCVGPHVFGYHLVDDDGKNIDGTGNGVLFQAIRRLPEGTRVRVVVSPTAIDLASPAAEAALAAALLKELAGADRTDRPDLWRQATKNILAAWREESVK